MTPLLQLARLLRLLANGRMAPDGLEAAKLRRFRRLADFAYRRCPHYRRVMDERGIVPAKCVASDFPVLTKEERNERFDAIVTRPEVTREGILGFLDRSANVEELYLGKYVVVHTSGTSGTLGLNVYALDEWICGSMQFARGLPIGLRKRLAYVGVYGGHFAGLSLANVSRMGTFRLFFDTRIFDINRPTSEIIAGLNAFKPSILCSYPLLLTDFAAAARAGELNFRPEAVVSGGEPMTPAERETVESAFGTTVVNVYASAETMVMGMSVGESGEMVLFEDDLILELMDDHVLVTNLFNFTAPLIRYRLDDCLVRIPAPKTRAFPAFRKVEAVIGRKEERLSFLNEDGRTDFIHPLILVEFYVRGLSGFQIETLGEARFRFHALFDKGLTEPDKDAIRLKIAQRMGAILAAKGMANVDFEVMEALELRRDPRSGKRRIVL